MKQKGYFIYLECEKFVLLFNMLSYDSELFDEIDDAKTILFVFARKDGHIVEDLTMKIQTSH
jgi:hypothetical protein